MATYSCLQRTRSTSSLWVFVGGVCAGLCLTLNWLDKALTMWVYSSPWTEVSDVLRAQHMLCGCPWVLGSWFVSDIGSLPPRSCSPYYVQQLGWTTLPTELSAVVETFSICVVQCGRHWSHVAIRHLKCDECDLRTGSFNFITFRLI